MQNIFCIKNGLIQERQTMKKIIKNKAFTLAEVLITLTIIGVIAALTIPNIVSNYQKQSTLSAFKKSYAVLNVALQNAIYEFGTPDTWDGVLDNPLPTGETVNSRAFAEHFKPYLKIEKDCDINVEKCWTKAPKNFSETSVAYRYDNRYRPAVAYKLMDGTNLYFSSALASDKYPFIMVDINGNKGPNRYAHDVFVFGINLKHQDRLDYGKLGGWNYHNHRTRNNIKNGIDGCPGDNMGSATYGEGCASLIIMDGFQIKDDYPWK